ncbi:transketolase [Iocasia frigidifontis]|uniref:Transketolase n=1 Tax=Iocasia fonsfrigidae TaxID=2682810 RepID=A0A8A7K8V6_9FIRM|nr:transketolase [Iocasia fonsfrigidae]QTL97640.1 transketolase [Iocasia fonsfrigidae]
MENSLLLKSIEIRRSLLKTIYNANMGHTGSSLSNVDILVTLFYQVMSYKVKDPTWEERDRFILSKGHGVESYYCILADLGYFPEKELDTFCQFKTRLIGHPNNKVPGVEVNTGALGHGLPIAVGMALAAKLDKKGYRVFVVMGDGEQAEGSIWEGAMAASHYKLDNLIGIIDRNRLQITGNTEDIMSLEPFKEKWQSFGWKVIEVNGHDIDELLKVFNSTPKKKDKPTIIIANTIKGKGVSFMENKAAWHHKVPDKKQLEKALLELSSQEGDLGE